jgi:Phytanoyl-CoA dioxygenase (PhyH)
MRSISANESAASLAGNFSKDGFVILPHALPLAAIGEYEDQILSELRDGYFEMLGDRSTYPVGRDRPDELEALFASAGNRGAALSSWLYARLVKRNEGQQLLQRLRPEYLASTLLGGDPSAYYLRRESTVTRVDLPGQSPIRLGWHQEVRYDPTRSAGIQFWLPLFRPSSWKNGSFEIAVGSHVEGILEVPLANPDGPGAQQYLVPNEVVDRYPHKIVEIHPGDVAILNCRTLHRSSDPARQRRIKLSLIGRCLHKGG